MARNGRANKPPMRWNRPEGWLCGGLFAPTQTESLRSGACGIRRFSMTTRSRLPRRHMAELSGFRPLYRFGRERSPSSVGTRVSVSNHRTACWARRGILPCLFFRAACLVWSGSRTDRVLVCLRRAASLGHRDRVGAAAAIILHDSAIARVCARGSSSTYSPWNPFQSVPVLMAGDCVLARCAARFLCPVVEVSIEWPTDANVVVGARCSALVPAPVRRLRPSIMCRARVLRMGYYMSTLV
jgi:hypothetical protein